MVRPCFLVVDREHASAISTRKLVIETAKFNVITAYSAAEALETFELYPQVNGVVLDSGIKDIACREVVERLKASKPDLPVIVVRSPSGEVCPGADYHLETFDPARLLDLLRNLRPRDAAAIDARNDELKREDE